MVRRFFSHRFISATFWMFVASLILSGGNYFYHLLMGRFLGPSLYGILESIISLLYILSIPMVTLTFVVIKFVSSYKGKGELSAIAGLYHVINKKLVFYGSLFSLLFIILSPGIKSFLHLPSYELLFLLIATFFVGLFNVLSKSLLQGVTHFIALAASNFSETIVKLSLSILLVALGFKVVGAFTGIVVSSLVGYLVALYFLQRFTSKVGDFKDGREILVFSVPVFLTNLSFTSLFTTDILLVRHFFPGVESGYYAALSVLGKILFFAASPVSLVMFPLVSEHHASKKKYVHFLLLSIGLTILIVSLLTSIYFLFPNFMVSLLFGKEYLNITPLLGHFAIFISLYTVSSLLANFYLSIHDTNPSRIVILAAVLQVVFIMIFHKSLFSVVAVSIFVAFLLLVLLLLYYPHAIKKQSGKS